MDENEIKRCENIRDDSVTDTDAVHYHFRQTYPVEIVLCLSCNRKFESRSMVEIFEHYYYIKHSKSCGDCLYCSGNVFEYKISGEVKKFHNCSRSKRGLE
ncbi:uncharacterized protein LOC129605355 [Condylostylus longicornis]|uniref:uncharacterized protein LOC129605355 n=1 Tax=Condylostylus longicornis TaxID=2530218 RepID=UPI00244E47BD|nr:uncharacterized protein LOC129605355 [Condylostylus longicornis]